MIRWWDVLKVFKRLQCFKSFPIHLHLNPFCHIFRQWFQLQQTMSSVSQSSYKQYDIKGFPPWTMCTLMQLFRWTRKYLQRSASERISQPLQKSHQSQFYIFCPGLLAFYPSHSGNKRRFDKKAAELPDNSFRMRYKHNLFCPIQQIWLFKIDEKLWYTFCSWVEVKIWNFYGPKMKIKYLKFLRSLDTHFAVG